MNPCVLAQLDVGATIAVLENQSREDEDRKRRER